MRFERETGKILCSDEEYRWLARAMWVSAGRPAGAGSYGTQVDLQALVGERLSAHDMEMVREAMEGGAAITVGIEGR